MSLPIRRRRPPVVLPALGASAMLALGGCASIVDGQTQSLSVKTQDAASREVVGARCTLSNDKGSWFLTTPGSVGVHRSYKDLAVSCQAPEQPAGKAVVKSATKGMAFGNLLVGGIVGAGVDVATGAAYDYPQLVTVTMGQVTGAEVAQVVGPAAAAPGPAAAAASSPGEAVRRYRYAGDAGTEFALRGHAAWSGKCVQRPQPKIAFVVPPAHGTVTVRNEPIDIPAGPDAACGGRSYDGVRLYYKAVDGFHGADRIAYTVDNGTRVFDVQVAVEVR
jgi:hypothetical protein